MMTSSLARRCFWGGPLPARDVSDVRRSFTSRQRNRLARELGLAPIAGLFLARKARSRPSLGPKAVRRFDVVSAKRLHVVTFEGGASLAIGRCGAFDPRPPPTRVASPKQHLARDPSLTTALTEAREEMASVDSAFRSKR